MTQRVPSRVSLRRFFGAFALLMALVWGRAGAAVSFAFTDSVMISDTVIRMHDIVRLAGADQAVGARIAALVIGQAAPPGHARFVNHYEAVRYIVAAHFPSVAVVDPPAGRTLVRTDSREDSLAAYDGLIRERIAAMVDWSDNEYVLTIENPNEGWRCRPGRSEVTVEELVDPRPKGRVNVRLKVTQPGFQMSVAARCTFRVTVPVLVTRLAVVREAPLLSTALELRLTDITALRYAPLTDTAAVAGMLASRALPPGAIVHEKCVRKAPVVRKDDTVYLTSENRNVRVSVAARAREPGGVGDRIWVQNLESKQLIRAEVCGKGRVKISTGEAI